MKLIKDFIKPKGKKKYYKFSNDNQQMSKAYNIFNKLKQGKLKGKKLSLQELLFIDRMEELNEKCKLNQQRFNHDYKILHSVLLLNTVLYQKSIDINLTDIKKYKK
tara:strand:+ start:2887 stop:3204 length:318 start_codon:yes stop_codon:yes gene_type:complete